MSERSPRTYRELAEVSVDQLRHIGPKRVSALNTLNISTVLDLLSWYPRRYIDRTRRVDLSDLQVGDEAAIYAEVTASAARRTRQGRSLVDVTVDDGTESLRISFFNQPWRATQLEVGVSAVFFGTLSEYRGRRQMTNPVVDVIIGAASDDRDRRRVGGVVALYPASGKAGLTSWEIGGFVDESLRRAGPFFDPLDDEIRDRLKLSDRTSSMWGIHRPDHPSDVAPARRRLVFDEFFRLQILVALRRRRLSESAAGISHPVEIDDVSSTPGSLVDASDHLLRRFLTGHRFAMTRAQQRVLSEIALDMAGPLPMHRLLQGDVGSGKTMVALAAMLIAVDGRRQCAMMAPTEVLAEQHAAALRRDVVGLTLPDPDVLGGAREVRVGVLTGRIKGKDRLRILQGLESGAIDIVVGTQALLGEKVLFRALGLVVIDEQHRFGVEQRAVLRDKGRDASSEARDPDLLVMTATPIPRTAAMVIFGDLDRSVIDELPAGRQPVTTSWERDAVGVAAAWRRVRDEVALGHRAYVICPLVEESERMEASSAVAERTRLATNELAGLSVGLLHGQMSAEEKEEALRRFRSGEVQVLVATVVIEVGVDVAEATVIVIEDAWRFGLAQLHQLRGRVGRSTNASHCFLLGEAPSPEATQRLEALVASTDGFALAEIDLELRGEGTLLGSRQRGRSDLRLASLVHDVDILELAHQAAEELVQLDALQSRPELVEELRLFVDDAEAEFLFRS